MKQALTILGLLLAANPLSAGSSRETPVTTTRLKHVITQLRPLHQTISPPGPMDWLAQHDEPGETFAQYLRSRPVTPRGKRNVLYIQPIGAFSTTQQRIVKLTVDYLARFFNLEVKTNRSVPLAAIPDRSRRIHPEWGDKQILTTYVLDNVLKPRLPRDAAAMIALTASDLWPGRGWNFVFGSASIRERVAVWSIYRNGDPDKDDESFKLCLMRTIKTAAHETCHMFSMRHCTAYECCMCGSNHRGESDRRPLYLCPECTAKLCWATQTDPVSRYKRLVEFCAQNGFEKERTFLEKSIRRLEE